MLRVLFASFKNDFLDDSILSISLASFAVIPCTSSSQSSREGSGTGIEPQLMFDALVKELDVIFGMYMNQWLMEGAGMYMEMI